MLRKSRGWFLYTFVAFAGVYVVKKSSSLFERNIEERYFLYLKIILILIPFFLC